MEFCFALHADMVFCVVMYQHCLGRFFALLSLSPSLSRSQFFCLTFVLSIYKALNRFTAVDSFFFLSFAFLISLCRVHFR